MADELAPRKGERTSPDGKAIRSNTAWRKLAEQAIADRNAAKASAAADRRRLDGLERLYDSARAVARDKAAEHASALESALLFGHEADELRDVLEGLAECLASLPLAVLASSGMAGQLSGLYLRAEILTAETPAERYARLSAELAGDGEGSADG